MTEQLRKLRWFWSWQDQKEEGWLSNMAAEGWHLDQVSLPSFYHFQKGAPARIVYRLDYQTLDKKNRESYLQLFEDAGWEHVGDHSGWVYFRKPYSDDPAPAIFNDNASKSKKYQRIMLYLVIFLPILVVLMPEIGERSGTFFLIIQGFYFALLLLYVYTMIRLLGRIGELNDKR